MARTLMIAFILVLFAQAAFAVVDPRPDVMGVYFDETGDQICNDTVIPFTPFSVWIVYTNPTPAMILGFEAGYFLNGTLLQIAIFWPCDIVFPFPPDLDDLHVICGEPFPTSQATPLVHFQYMHLPPPDVPEVTFHLEKASGSSLPGDNPYVILADGSPFEVLAGEPAYTTSNCGVPTENMGWGTIKSLYR
jgi:hypothetical protein